MRAVADENDHPTREHFDTTVDNLGNNLREHSAAAVSGGGGSNLPGDTHPDAAILGGLLAILRLLG